MCVTIKWFNASPQNAAAICQGSTCGIKPVQPHNFFPDQTLLMTFVTEAFIQLGFATERFLDKNLAQVEAVTLGTLKSAVPGAYQTVESFLVQYRSIHADHLPLTNLFHVFTLIAAYFAIVFGGKALTQRFIPIEKKPDVGFIVKGHNLFLLFLSLYMAGNVAYEAFVNRGYTLFTNPSEEIPAARGLAKALWVFYFSKVFEFVDTFIMVLKQNWRQISFLHLYHHASIFVVWWSVCYFAPSGEAYFSAVLNSLIHVVMYSYYFLSACGYGKPDKRDFVSKAVRTVKPYITMGQMTQFCCMMVQATYDIASYYYFDKNSNLPSYTQHYKDGKAVEGVYKYPIELTAMLWFYMWTMLALFGNFYVKNYTKKPIKSKDTSKAVKVEKEE